MSSQVTERNAKKVIEVLEGTDLTLAELEAKTGLSKGEAWRAINYLKAQRRIESRGAGVFHLRTVEAATEQEDREAPAASDAPAPEEAPAESEPVESPAAADVETIVIDGWTCYLTYSHLLPPLSPEEYAELKADIQEHGMLVPVLLSQTGQDRHYHVLDGQHRLRIAAELGLGWMDFDKNYRNLLTEEQREELALNLNLHRRHLTPEQRRDLALKFRQQGMSYRQIGETLGVDASTAMRDVKAGVANATPEAGDESAAPVEQPETVIGMDGKAYPAAQPISESQTRRDADRLLTRYAEQPAVTTQTMINETGITDARLFKALNLLVAEGKAERTDQRAATPSKPGTAKYVFKAAPDEATPAEMTPASAELTADSTALQEPERPAYQAIPGSGTPATGLPVSVETARELIIDALKKSQRALTRGELRKYAGLLDQKPVFEQAFTAMMQAGSLASMTDKRFVLRHHFPEMIEHLREAERADGQAEESDAAHTLPDALDKLFVDLGAVRMFARAIQRVEIDWTTYDVERRKAGETLIRETYNDLVDLQNKLAQLGIDIKTSSEESASAGA